VKLVVDPAVVAKVAVPFKIAVIVPALKLPEASRSTMVSAPLAEVAAFAALAPFAINEAVTPETEDTTVLL